MTKRSAVVTGGTSGLGLETARGLVRAGYNVTVIGRRAEAGMTALADLRRDAMPHQVVVYEQADLSEFADISRVARILDRDGEPLDVLVNNAGAFFKQRELTANGVEKSMATNHFSMFILTALLFARLDAAPAARIVNVASSVYRFGRVNLDDPTFAQGRPAMGGYADSKLANIMFTLELAKRLTGTRITVNALHPGSVRSNFNRFLKAWWASWLTIPAEDAARTPLYLAMSQALPQRTGGYYSKQLLRPLLPHARNAELNRRLWELSDQRAGSVWERALAR